MLYFCVHKNYLDKILENIKDFMMEENFDKWNQIKQKTQNMEETIFFNNSSLEIVISLFENLFIS